MKKIGLLLLSIRPINILVGVIFAFLSYQYIHETTWGICFAISVALAMIAGNIWNDKYDRKSDKINKPNAPKLYHFFSNKWVNRLTFITLTLSILSTLYVKSLSFTLAVLACNVLLLAYGKRGKYWGFLGNYIVALLSALCIAMPIITHNNMLANNFEMLSMGAFLAFVFSFMREWVKDMEDIKGDLYMHARTGVIRMGLKKSMALLRIYGILLAGLLLYIPILYSNIYYLIWFLIYIPIVITLIFKWNINRLKIVSTWLKVVFLSGVLVYFI